MCILRLCTRMCIVYVFKIGFASASGVHNSNSFTFYLNETKEKFSSTNVLSNNS
jgi:hypothetical protein